MKKNIFLSSLIDIGSVKMNKLSDYNESMLAIAAVGALAYGATNPARKKKKEEKKRVEAEAKVAKEAKKVKRNTRMKRGGKVALGLAAGGAALYAANKIRKMRRAKKNSLKEDYMFVMTDYLEEKSKGKKTKTKAKNQARKKAKARQGRSEANKVKPKITTRKRIRNSSRRIGANDTTSQFQGRKGIRDRSRARNAERTARKTVSTSKAVIKKGFKMGRKTKAGVAITLGGAAIGGGAYAINKIRNIRKARNQM